MYQRLVWSSIEVLLWRGFYNWMQRTKHAKDAASPLISTLAAQRERGCMKRKGRFEDARSLVRHAENHLPAIRDAYESSLRDKTVSVTLLVEIKNLLENLRSALDFTACGLFDRYGSSKKAAPKVYFPYATATQDRVAFERSGRIDACIPGLRSRNKITSAILKARVYACADVRRGVRGAAL